MGSAKTIHEELTDLDEVQSATLDSNTKSATVTADKTVQTPERLTKMVQATGDCKTWTVYNIES
ncbi:cation transporter [Flavobacterium sp. ALD4]|uniref:cation transporter n=1 Tax=Flavobacterium sp. ALD4 TaxID=2058314 RepID=UPI0035161156